MVITAQSPTLSILSGSHSKTSPIPTSPASIVDSDGSFLAPTAEDIPETCRKESGTTSNPSLEDEDADDLDETHRRSKPRGNVVDAFQSYLCDIRRFGLLTHDEEIELARRSAAGDLQARRRLVEANLRLVIAIAHHYTGSGVPLTDLVQEGNIGLMRAAEKFDAERGCHFGTYATWWIRQAVSRAAGEYSRMIHLPEHIVIRLRKMRRIITQLSQENGLDPSPEQIAAACDFSVEEVIYLLGVVEQPISLDAPIDDDHRNSLAEILEDSLNPSPADIISRHFLSEDLQESLNNLTPREQGVINLRFGIGDGQCHTLVETGRMLGLSRERVRQLEIIALIKLRHVSGRLRNRSHALCECA